MPAQVLTCVIVDDEIHNTNLLSDYVSQIPFLKLITVFQKPMEALAFILKNPVDLLITDINMPKISGLELYEYVSSEIQPQVIFITGYPDKILEALKYAAVDYLQKPVPFHRFEQATAKALKLADTRIYIDIPQKILTQALNKLNTLSPAEKRVFDQIASGKTTKEIADYICISEGTVSLHRHKIREKLNIPNHIVLKELALLMTNTLKRLK